MKTNGTKTGAFGRLWTTALCLLALTWQVHAQCPIPGVTSSSATCGQGATLTASGSTGIFRWYDAPTGGNLLGTGPSFSTPSLFAQSTYYVEAVNTLSNPSCISPRAAVLVTVNNIPVPIAIGDTINCGSPATLFASGSSGQFQWFAAPSGGQPIGTGSSFNPPFTSQNALFYVQATTNLNPVQTATFNYNGGQQTWTVPAGVFSISVDVQGAQGGNNTSYGNRGGFGGQVLADLAVTPGQIVYIRVGGWPNTSTTGGYNGGANSNVSSLYGQGGGGATDLRIGGTGLANRVIVAGGGGGGGWNCGTDGSRGGDGGGLNGEAGYYCSSTGNTSYTGRGGSQNSGGAAGTNWCCPSSGSLGNGGSGGYRGAGGGGGYYGGGGSSYGGAGGGSSYSDPVLASNVTHNQGVRTGHGVVNITFVTPFCNSARIPVPVIVNPISNPSTVNASGACGDTLNLSATGSTGFFRWFDTPTGGNPISTNAQLTRQFVTTSDTFYVEAVTDPNPFGSFNFNYTGGTQQWTVPAGVFTITVDLYGAQGGTNPSYGAGGLGGQVTADLAVTPGQTIFIYVGGQPNNTTSPGWNGGGFGSIFGRGGGGATDIRIGGTSTNNRVLIAGGGGGSGYDCGSFTNGGGAGGGSGTAGAGFRCNGQSTTYVGQGGTQNNGGTGANNGGQSGQLAQGGNGSSYAGGGGGGYYGGGGGWYGGGGGGSSFANPNLASNINHNQGVHTGNGTATISYTRNFCSSQRIPAIMTVSPISAPVTQGDSVTCGTPVTLTATGTTYPVNWYDAPTGGNLLATGSQVSLPPVLGSDTLFAGVSLINNISGNHTFNFTGAPQTWTVPNGVTQVQVDIRGAQGGASLPSPGNNPGGLGGRVQTSLTVTPGETLTLHVGGTTSSNTGGWNGGGNGNSSGAGGGGGSDIRSGGTGLSNRVVTAGGGGGSGWNCSSGMSGGNGGGSGQAQQGFNCNNQDCNTGSGATPTSGGQGATCGGCATAGTAGQGGTGGTCGSSGGGGGGGQFGGGGGRYAGGGGGSSFADAIRTSNTTHTQGFQSGNGQIVISYNINLSCSSPRVPAPIWLDSLPAPTASGDTSFCGTGSAPLSVTGPQGAYTWYDTIGGTIANIGQNWTTPPLMAPQTYFVNYTVNGCPSKYDTVRVQATPFPVANLAAVTGTYCQGSLPLDLGFVPPVLQGTLNLTNCGATGRSGPTQQQANTAYGPGVVTVNAGIQEWTVPFTGTYRITVAGAQGGDGGGNQGGLGAVLEGDFQLTAGTTLRALVGQRGGSRPPSGSNSAGAGGGGTFVVDGNNTPLIVAGGGGGAGSGGTGLPGDIGLNGTNSPSSSGQGGINGGGGGAAQNGTAGTQNAPGGNGNSCSFGAGGGGFYTKGGENCNGGAPNIAGESFLSGGLGGVADVGRGGVEGGFGGGAGVGHRASAGGGWSGGGGDGNVAGGGGGGSFNAGTNTVATSGVNPGNGFVTITYNIPQPSDTFGIWSGPGIVDSINGIFNANQANIGTNYAVYTVSNNGCTFQDSIAINVVAGPDASITTAPPSYCDYSNSDTLAALNSGGIWSGNGIADPNQGIFDPTSVAPGTYQVFHTLVDQQAGCSVTDSLQIVVNPTPNASVVSPGTVCSADQPFNLSSVTPGGTWSGSGITNTSNGTFSPNANLVGSNTIVYSVTQNNCSNTDSLVVTVLTSPNASIANAPMQVCANASPLLLSAATAGGSWTGNGMANPNSGLFSPQLAGTGTAQIVYTISATNNCSASDTAFVVVNPLPQITVSPNTIQQACAGTPVTISATGAVNYQWMNNGNPISGATQANLTTLNAGAYTVMGIDGNGCSANSPSVQVNILPNPVIFQINAPAVCEGQATNFTQNSGVGQGGVISTYQWDFGNGNTGSGFQTNETYSSSGQYTAQLIATTPEGCADTATQLVTVHPRPNVDSVLTTGACFPNPANFQAFTSGASVQTYQWNFGNGNTGNGQSVIHQYPSAGTFYYTITATSNLGCQSTFNGNVVVDNKPEANYLFAPGCTGQPLQFFDLSNGNISGWNWDFGPAVDNQQNPSYSYNTPGNYTVTLTVTTPQGCTDVHTSQVPVSQTPDATWYETNQGVNQVQFTPFNPLTGANHLWTFGDGTSSNAISPLKQYSNTGFYQVCLTTTKNGCESTVCDTIYAKDVFGLDGQDGNAIGLQVYPNPFGESFRLSLNLPTNQEATLLLQDLRGRTAASQTLAAQGAGLQTWTIDTKSWGLSSGTYLLSVKVGEQWYTTRIVHLID